MKHALCRQEFKSLAAFNRHVGTSGAPDFLAVAPQCPDVLRLRRSDAQYQRAALATPQPASSPASEQRNVTPRADKKYRTNAERQRAYRDRKRG